MIPPMPNPDYYNPSPDTRGGALNSLDYVADLLDWLHDNRTPVWITGGSPTHVFAAIERLGAARLLIREAIATLEPKENAASCQNAAPRLPETTEPQAV